MRCSVIFALAVLLCGAAVGSVLDESACVFGTEQDGACVCDSEFIVGGRCNIRLEQVSSLESCLFIYEDEEDKNEAECLLLVPFECDDEFAVAISSYRPDGVQQMLATDIASGSDSELELCSDGSSGSCKDCYLLSNINMEGAVVTADFTQTTMCEDDSDNVSISLGPVQHTGASCGEEGYYYVPCGFTPPATAGEVEEESKRSVEEDEARLIGFEHCVVFSEAPSVPLVCPVVVMDTCGGVAYEISYGGVPMFFELEHGKDDQECVASSLGLVCLDVVEVALGSASVGYTTTVTLTVESEFYSQGQYTLELPRFEETFPLCGESKDTCGAREDSDSGASGSNDTGSVPESSVGDGDEGEGEGDDDGDGDDNGGSEWWLWLIAVPVAFCGLLLFASMVVLALALMYKRRNRTLTLSDAGLEMDVEELGDE